MHVYKLLLTEKRVLILFGYYFIDILKIAKNKRFVLEREILSVDKISNDIDKYRLVQGLILKITEFEKLIS